MIKAPTFSSSHPSPTYLLVGNYGVSNAGDEILREYFLRKFPEIEWKVLSAHPGEGEFPRIPAGLRSFLSSGWLRTIRALKSSRGMVFGGGALFTDSESPVACFLWFLHALAAHIHRKPVLLAFQGIGPFRTRTGEWCARWVTRHAAFISVRDGDSYLRVEKWRKSTEVIQSFDPSLRLLPKENSDDRTKNVIIYIPRFSTKNRTLAGGLIRRLTQTGDKVRIVSLQPPDEREKLICARLASDIGADILFASSLQTVRSDIANAKFVITERFHGAMLALSQEVPFLAVRQRERDKLEMLARFCGCPVVDSSLSSIDLPRKTNWEDVAERLPAVREKCLALARNGEEALRVAFAGFSSSKP